MKRSTYLEENFASSSNRQDTNVDGRLIEDQISLTTDSGQTRKEIVTRRKESEERIVWEIKDGGCRK